MAARHLVGADTAARTAQSARRGLCSAYAAPLALGVPLAVAIHDVSFAAAPHWFRPREGARRRLLTRQAARAAEVIFTISEFSRREIVERLGVAAERIRVTYPSVTPRRPARRSLGEGGPAHRSPGEGGPAFGSPGEGGPASRSLGEGGPAHRSPGEGGPARRSLGEGGRDPLVLYVGSIFNRRRLPSTISAFAAATARRPETRLVVAGADRSYPPLDLAGLAAEAGVAARVEVRNYVTEAELDDLYGRASVFVFLSDAKASA